MKILYFDKNLKKSVKDLPSNLLVKKMVPDLISQYVYVYLFNQKQGTSSTKTRGEVRGGGKKPWRQKGTGRARHGSIRSPIWVGGGVSHGPKPYKKILKMPKKMKKLVFKMILTSRANEKRVYVVDFAKITKTKDAFKVLQKILQNGFESKKTLIVHGGESDVYKSTKNLPKTIIVHLDELNSFDLLKGYNIIFTVKAFESLSNKN